MATVARICGVSRPTVSNWFNNPEKVSTISRSNAEAICAHFKLEVSPAWLSEGVGPRIATPSKGAPSSPGQRFDAVTEDEHRMLLAFRGMSDDDRAELTAEMEQRAKRWADIVAKVLAQTRPAKNGTS